MLELYVINNLNVYIFDSKGCYLNGSVYYLFVQFECYYKDN